MSSPTVINILTCSKMQIKSGISIGPRANFWKRPKVICLIKERYIKISKTLNGKYSVHIYEPVPDKSLALILGEEYQIWDHKVFETKEEATAYAKSLGKK